MTDPLTYVERQVYDLWVARRHYGFLQIGRELGISDAEARRHFDKALDKLKSQRPIQREY